MFFDKIVFVEALTTYSGSYNKEAYVAYSGFLGQFGILTSALRMNIQPMSAQMTILVDGVIGKTFVGYTTASGLTEGMRVTVSGTHEQFIVRGRQNFDYEPLKHSEVTLFKRDPQ